MASKRAASSPPPVGSSSAGKKRLVFEPLQIGPIASLDELELKTLAFQNRKLGLRLTQRINIEEELRVRIDQLEKRQMQDDAVINVINRYWNQLNEDIRILLQRFDTETGDESEKQNEDRSTTSFLSQLATWHKEELDEKLASRVQVSQRAVAKIIQVFDHMNQRNERLSRLIRGDKEAISNSNSPTRQQEEDGGEENKTNEAEKDPKEEAEGNGKPEEVKKDSQADAKPANEEDAGDKQDDETEKELLNIDDEVRQLNKRLQRENMNLHRRNTALHEKNHFLSLKHAELAEGNHAELTRNEELQNKLDDVEYELQKCKMRNEKLETTLAETQEKLKMYVDRDGGKLNQKVVLSGTERKSVEQLHNDLEEQRELAASRLAELEETSGLYKEALKDKERLKMELSTLPEHVVVETTEHKCLQSQFSVLYNEAMQLKTQLEDSRNQLSVAKNAHMRQIEQMEAEELLAQKKLRTEVIQLEDMLAQVRKEYEMLRIEFEQNLAANEQTGPINKEMRNLISSLQSHNVQLKGEVARYKRKGKEAANEMAKLRKDLEEAKAAEIRAIQHLKRTQHSEAQGHSQQNPDQHGRLNSRAPNDDNNTNTAPGSGEGDELSGNLHVKEEDTISDIKQEPDAAAGEAENSVNETAQTASGGETATPAEGSSPDVKPDTKPLPNQIYPSPAKVKPDPGFKELKDKLDEVQRMRSKEADALKDLKNQLKKAQNDVKEMKLLLDMYKACTKEQREKAQIMVAEKKARSELEETKLQMKKLTETKKEEKKRLADEEATKRIKQLEDANGQLQKQVAGHKQEEEALLSEMEVTGQAFEDMQEQNSRLIQQLREKDDANFKLMSERIKSNQIQRISREEREMLIQQVNTLQTQVETQNQVVRKLEEKERLLTTNLATVDKELSMRQQAMEMHKRKAIESAQSAADLKLHLEKYHAQIKEAQQTVSEKTSALEAEAFKTKRLHEELVLVKRKVERLRKIEMASDMDEILKEEIREYKETLTCPSCKVKRKDAVLTKCFHCFCYDCLRTRYETRQRKCPKCNAAFGASDYHRLYLA